MSGVSRRRLLQGAMLTLAGVAGAVLLPGEAAAKLSQKAAHYQTQPQDGHSCAGCRHFRPPHACETVGGRIAPNGWCTMWAPKG